MEPSGWRHRIKIAALIYGACVLGAALPVFGWDVCTQYDMGLFAPLFAPLLGVFGSFVIFALAFSAAIGGSLFAIFLLAIGLVMFAALAVLALAALRGERRALWGAIFLGGVAFSNAITTAAFCVSLSA